MMLPLSDKVLLPLSEVRVGPDIHSGSRRIQFIPLFQGCTQVPGGPTCI